MRLLCTISKEQSEQDPHRFSYFLKSQGIENTCEECQEGEGDVSYRIWVHDEDHLEKAVFFYQEYQRDPENPKFHISYQQAIAFESEKEDFVEKEVPEAKRRQKSSFSNAPYGFLTTLILLSVIVIFIWSQLQRGVILPPKLKGIAEAPLLAPIDRALLFDYPKYFQLRDQLLSIYTPQEIKEGKPPGNEALSIMKRMRKTPYWTGFYEMTIQLIQKKTPLSEFKAPLFEKISQRQYWRLITPAFLHFDLLHIFFNLLWFIMLGNQIEFRIRPSRYFFLVLVVGVISNVAQYLMSGSFFMGLSGIVVGMVGFIWARQQKAPWEGYLLNRMTLLFLGIFVIGMFLLQLIFFILEVTGTYELSFPIANTAHLAGGIVGYLLGRISFFALGRKKN